MAFGLDFSKHFTSQSKKLPRDIKQKLKKCLEHLASNPRHPTLRTHKIKSSPGFFGGPIFEAYVDKKYRITWEYKDANALYLRNVDNHDERLEHP